MSRRCPCRRPLAAQGAQLLSAMEELAFLPRRVAPWLEEAPAVGCTSRAAAPPGAACSPAPSEARLCSAPSQPCSSSLSEGSPPSGFHMHRGGSHLRLSSRQPGPRQHFYIGACAYANVHAHTMVFLCAHIQETWEELVQRASWRKLIYIFYWGR